MAIVRVNPNLEAEVTGSIFTRGPMERVLGEIAEDVADRARGIAWREYYRFGGYTRGIQAETGINERGELVGRVNATDWKSHWAEAPPRQERGRRRGHILARAAQQVGLEVVAGALLGGFGGGGLPALPAPRQQLAIGGRR